MSALVESPLQLLCAVEAYAAGHVTPPAATQARIVARSDVPTLATAVGAVRDLGLPDGLDVTVGPVSRTLGGDPVHLVGDPFSGVFQTALARGTAPGRIVVVDDGLATLDMARRLVEAEPMVRLSTPTGPLRYTLGAVTTRRLRRLARAGRLTVCTMLPLDDGLTAGLTALGVEVVEHSFGWLASRSDAGAPPAIEEPTVVVGSGLVADRLVHADQYAAWLAGLAADGPVRYIPHRRHDALVTALFERLPGVRVDVPGAPVEIRLRRLGTDQRVVSLPSTSAVTLTRLLTPRGVAVLPQDVPDSWWTPRATPALREHLSVAAGLARAADAGRSAERPARPAGRPGRRTSPVA
ncbi:hypothetical protein BCE75_1066 [Isoptericola sp. CG 20/1183]|uniref:Uncharacterized protein n=1 Tax=Isoptericola halotolerans TaxID=300560 RepID=A0ABX5EEX7_9MICO|nr:MULTISPECIES: hypothetical protein [Isoptericola]PRZ06553.1 hypothetical protein BCL65_106228 [Isoptericola halotolerans]PRZ06641.1 hypothetical protein BCE75_1066 [Isoptericola sp. CG 20/1183]